MMEQSESELLIEIAKLLRKYGPEAFERLAFQLRSPDFLDRMVTILSTTAAASRKAKANGTPSPAAKRLSRDFRSSLVELKTKEPEKAAVLLKLHDGLMARTFLPTLRELQAFAVDNALPPLRAGARGKAVVELLEALVSLPLEPLRKVAAKIRPVTVDDNRSLEGWTRIILNKEPRTKIGD